jgi:murein DD-endopeptidase MepM/ murein hydrolase activator NlpD
MVSNLKLLHKIVGLLVFATFILQPASPSFGQSQDEYPVYIVQSGDTLSTIAVRFNVSVQEIVDLNGITNPNVLSVGTPLKIPGIQGVSGIITTKAVPFGENLWTLNYRYQLPTDTLIRINKITSPNEIYAGTELIVTEPQDITSYAVGALSKEDYSLTETALLQNSSTWELALINFRDSIWDFLPGEPIYNYQERVNKVVSPYAPIQSININPLPLAQGKTIVIKIQSTQPLSITGTLGNYPLRFFNFDQNYVALQGIHRNAEIGLASLTLQATADDGTIIRINQPLLLVDTLFRTDKPLTVPPETIDPAIIGPEEEFVRSLTEKTTPTRYWDGKFLPVNDEPECITAWYGDGRIYNNSYRSFHTGVDYGVCSKPSLNIYSPAAGVVVFVGPLTVRGNATIIDHGWGVYSGFWHQKEFKVQVGDVVTAGQLIGYIGATGRASGPHLHWEVWVNGNQVDPLDWLANIYP